MKATYKEIDFICEAELVDDTFAIAALFGKTKYEFSIAVLIFNVSLMLSIGWSKGR